MNTSRKIQTIAELQNYLEAFPQPKEGYVRVYRGQSSFYANVIASAHRKSNGDKMEIPGRNEWNAYCSLVSQYMEKAESNRNIHFTEEHPDFLRQHLFWYKAISQHYGPGTEFLDVTRSLSVALWFAFHSVQKVEAYGVAGQQGTTDADIYHKNSWIMFNEQNENAWLYVFDVPVAEDVLSIQHGSLVDISSRAPVIYRKSARIAAQKACLIFCDGKKKDNGDCSSFLICPPINLSGGDFKLLIGDSRASDLFPSPEYDEWYKRFLQIPKVPVGFTPDGHLLMEKNLPVETYVDESDFNSQGDPYLQSIVNKSIVAYPPLVYPYYKTTAATDASLDSAIPLLLKFPLISKSPPIESGMWNEFLLWNSAFLGPSENIDTKSDSVPHHNLFIEFSSLEVPVWDEIDLGNPYNWIRAIWLRSYDKRFIKVRILVQHYPDNGLLEYSYVIHLHSLKKALYVTDENNSSKNEVLLISLPHIARVVYVALAIVGDCSKAKKMKPIPVLTYHEVDKKSGRSKKMALIAVDASSAYMESIFKLPESNQHYYGLFNSETGKPYENIGQSLSTSSSEEIELIKPFAEMDLDDIQTAINNSIKKE